jgi:hypothetical protein
MEVECSERCRGAGWLRYPPSGAASATHVKFLALFRFRIAARGAATVRAKLTSAGRRFLAKKKRLIASVTIVLSTGLARRATYVSDLDLTRSTPVPRRRRRH